MSASSAHTPPIITSAGRICTWFSSHLQQSITLQHLLRMGGDDRTPHGIHRYTCTNSLYTSTPLHWMTTPWARHLCHMQTENKLSTQYSQHLSSTKTAPRLGAPCHTWDEHYNAPTQTLHGLVLCSCPTGLNTLLSHRLNRPTAPHWLVCAAAPQG